MKVACYQWDRGHCMGLAGYLLTDSQGMTGLECRLNKEVHMPQHERVVHAAR